jgi:hypothetical protein
MINKIISGGQTGADRAALDVAIEFDIPHGGWVPKGRVTEKGPLPERYQLQEMATSSYADRTEQNVIDADGTLILTQGKLSGGSQYTRDMAGKHDRPCLHVNLETTAAFAAVKAINYWIERHKIQVLNVAGSRESEDPKIYKAVRRILSSVLHMNILSKQMPDPQRAVPLIPATVEEALKDLTARMKLLDLATIAKMDEEELGLLQATLGRYIWSRYGLWTGNKSLLESCRRMLGSQKATPDEASALIIRELWRSLQETHRLRVIK